MSEIYLGDSLYASFDGWHIKLRAPRANGDHIVFLDASIFKELAQFAEKVWHGKEPA
jgi:hypothetical protein